jgi:multisubunit Na+/H+ antiporter MnhF subunit
MELADVVAWALLAVLLGFVGMVVYATFRQIDGEAREAAERRDR